MIVLEIEGLSCIRGHRVLFRDMSLSLKAGSLLSLEGPNGAGKTSLLRLIAGFLQPAAGTIRLRTNEITAADPDERAALIGWLGHQDAVKPQMSVREQLVFWISLYGGGRDPCGAMTAFGLAALADVPGQYLSAGQKRRLALARLTLCGRPLWLLDEPFAALDTSGKALVAKTVSAHCAAGGLAVAATHEPLGLSCETLRLGVAS